MVKIAEVVSESKYGPNAENVSKLLSQIDEIAWFKQCGQSSANEAIEQALKDFASKLNVHDFEFQYLTKNEFGTFLNNFKIEAGPLWERLQQIPKELKGGFEELGRTELLTLANNDVPEYVFHGAYEGAFRELEEVSSEAVTFAVGAAMYITGLACAWELLGDHEKWQENPFQLLMNVLEQGYLPLGVYDQKFYVL